MGKIIIANITWSSNDWNGWDPKDKDVSGHGYVVEGNEPHECNNFNLEKDYNKSERIYGFVQFNRMPKISEKKNLIIFYSQGKIVGFYGNAGFLKSSWGSQEREKVNNMNVYGDKNLSFVLKNKIDDIKEKGYLEDKKRVGQIGFNYINDPRTVLKILDESLELNVELKESIERLKNFVLEVFFNSINDAAIINTEKPNNTLEYPKNLILYGPPGTGKTYITKSKAVQIIDNLTDEEILSKDISSIFERYDELWNQKRIFFTTFHQSYSYEQFIEGISVENDPIDKSILIYDFKPGIFKIACDKCEEINNRVVLVIDEINRGNVSKIFGELITSIETNKRWGMDEQLPVKLPYSKDDFYVPSEIYIIGTMNTADRSLVQLDTALRRRFEFEEMMPKYDFWSANVGDFDLNLFLQKLNEKITENYDREHQIGHSFLMKVKDIKELQRAWENKIMPLLQEYFYANYDDLAKVIGDQSEYLKKNVDKWKLNMKASDFAKEFSTIYNFVTKDIVEKTKSDE